MKKILGIGNALVDILMILRSDRALDKLQLPKGSMQLIDETTLEKIQDETLLLNKHIATGSQPHHYQLARLGGRLHRQIGNDPVGEFLWRFI